MPDQLQLKDWSNLIDQNLGKIYGTSCKIWILNKIISEMKFSKISHPIDSSNWNESQMGSDNFHCPFGSKNPKKEKKENKSYVEKWSLTPAIG